MLFTSPFIRSFALTSSLIVALASPSFADQFKTLKVVGNKRLEPSTIQAHMGIKVGDNITPETLNAALKNLYATKLVTDVKIAQQGSTLSVAVQESPIINRVAFEGNKKLSDDAIKKEVKLAPRTPYNLSQIQRLKQKLLMMYRLAGRYAATVEPKIIFLDDNRVDVVFEINEGPSTYVERIIFQGNKDFSDSTLDGAIQTKESRWYRFLTSDDTYDPDRMAYDQNLLQQFYLNQGYLDFRVVSALAELDANNKDFYITYVLDEGKPYTIATVTVDNPFKTIPTEDFTDVVTLKPGNTYSADSMDDTMEALTKVAGDQGYAFVDPQPVLTKHPENNTVDITLKLKQGPKVFVERIDIQGNTRTRDDVIRREFRLAEGDPFNATKLRRTEERLRNLNFFKKVKISPVQGSTPDTVIIKTEVEEQITGEIQFAVGYGTQSGIMSDITIKERNLLGKGQEAVLRLMVGKSSKGVDFSFTEPFFMHRRLAAGFNLSAYKAKESGNGINTSSVGGKTFIGYEINEHLSQQLFYGLSRNEMTYSSTTSAFIQSQPSRSVKSSVGFVTAYDRRNSTIDPRKGYLLKMGNEFVGLGGTAHFLRNTASAHQYFPIFKESTLALVVDGGIMTPTNGKVIRTMDRFELGGFQLRGFDFDGIGPRDIRGGRDALGGLRFYTTTAELQFPVGLPKEFGVMASTFVEGGSLWNAQIKDPNLYDQNFFRASYGVGLNWQSPMGPIRLDYAIPFRKGRYDQTRQFLFGFTSRF